MTRRRLALPTFTTLLALGAAFGGCATSDVRNGNAVGGSGDGVGSADGDFVGDGTPDGSGDGVVPGSGVGCNKMDIVFVVDNSFSMEEEQAGLAASFPQMIEVLNSFRGGSLDYRVAVTTTAFPDELFGQPITSAEEGAFLKAPAMTRPWLERNDPDLSATFTQVATVGVEGSGQEQPLRAAVASVTARIDDGTNNDPSGATFLRSDALLAFVIVTDEDDSSGPPSPIPFVTLGLDPVSKFIGELDAAAGDRSHWAAAVIAAQTDCESAFGEANDAVRLKQFVADTGSNAAFGDICEGNLSGSLEAALNTFKVACEEYDVF